jgi:hypothetical protein
MADVDSIPFHLIPKEWAFDAEKGEFLRTVLERLYGLRERTGGDDDVIQNIEITQVTQDGGNRTYRRYRDELDELQSQIVELKKTNRYRDDIDYLQSQISEIKKGYRFDESMQCLSDQIAESKRQNKLSLSLIDDIKQLFEQRKSIAVNRAEQETHELRNELFNQKRLNRSLEQRVFELEQRIDSGV